MIVTAVGQIGCIPYQLARYENRGNGTRCNESINQAIVLFNTGLQRLVDALNHNAQLPGAKFIYLNAYQSISNLVNNAASYGNSNRLFYLSST